MQNVLDGLQERGLVAQSTNLEGLREVLGKEKVRFYIGFDGTADSLHIGHFFPIMLMMRMQRAGHIPIALLGTGTAVVGDPTGKTDMRKMLSVDEINHNAEIFQQQISKFIDFSEGKALLRRNGDWLFELKYMEFIREVGIHFSVNRMLTAESVKARMEKGLSFMEFNYMILQSYDFYHMFKEDNCILQMGGDDQWSNIIHGVELIRRMEGKEAYGLTVPLLTNRDGKKMGKTEKGALWLDPNRTSPYEFFQYWRNINDEDVINTMKFITFIPMEEIREMEKLEGSGINQAKERLAHELTALIHGKDEADKALKAAKSLFISGSDDENMPSTQLTDDQFIDGSIGILDLLVTTGLAPSKAEGRRLVTQGGISIDGVKVVDCAMLLEKSRFEGEGITLKKGKKAFNKVICS